MNRCSEEIEVSQQTCSSLGLVSLQKDLSHYYLFLLLFYGKHSLCYFIIKMPTIYLTFISNPERTEKKMETTQNVVKRNYKSNLTEYV